MAHLASDLVQKMNVVANHEAIPVIVRRKSGFFSAQAVLPSSAAIDQSFSLFPGEALKMTAADIESVSKSEAVEQIWLDLPVHTCLNVSVPKIAAPRVWEAGFKGTGIRVGIVDTGIDDTHPDFAGRIRAMKSFVDNTPADENGHGSHVAGIVAGSGAKSGGKYVGVAPEADLFIAKVLDADGSGSMSGVMAGIEWVILDHKVQVINLSLGGPGPCDGTDALSSLCNEAVQQMRVVVCAAAGNAGPGAGTVGSPGCAQFVITIGAVDDTDRMAGFSSRGPTSDGRVKPDIVYPGVGITAPQAAGTQLGPVAEEGYITISGTSMATPHASGVVALMLQANPELKPDQVKQLMLDTALNLNFPPNDQGKGRGDAFEAYLKAAELAPPTPEPSPTPPPPTPEPPPPTPEPPPPTPEPPPPPTPEPPPPPPTPEPPPPPPQPEPQPQPPGCLGGIASLFKR